MRDEFLDPRGFGAVRRIFFYPPGGLIPKFIHFRIVFLRDQTSGRVDNKCIRGRKCPEEKTDFQLVVTTTFSIVF